MADIARIDVTWKESEKGRVCTAIAISEKGEDLAKAHITLPGKYTGGFETIYASSSNEVIEKAAEAEVKFIVDNPDLFQ